MKKLLLVLLLTGCTQTPTLKEVSNTCARGFVKVYNSNTEAAQLNFECK